MTVELTSPVLGQDVGYSYTGPLEAWLLAEGYAKQAGYTGPGVSNTGAASTAPDNDPRLHENREAPRWPAGPATNVTIANDGTNLTKAKFPAPGNADFDAAGVDTEAVVVTGLEPETGAAAGGDVVRIYADNIEGTTGVTFGGVAGTALDVNEDAGYLDVTTPAHAAGAVDVVVTDATGSDTVTGGFTYE